MKSKNLKFKLKQVSEKTVLKAIKGMKNKKKFRPWWTYTRTTEGWCRYPSHPTKKIINVSIAEGKFPENWKQGNVTPVLKKGSSTAKNNYRPVTCLSILSKVS